MSMLHFMATLTPTALSTPFFTFLFAGEHSFDPADSRAFLLEPLQHIFIISYRNADPVSARAGIWIFSTRTWAILCRRQKFGWMLSTASWVLFFWNYYRYNLPWLFTQ